MPDNVVDARELFSIIRARALIERYERTGEGDPMADFCKQCSLAIFDHDFRDLAVGEWEANKDDPPDSIYRVICEGCGITYVNREGECVAGTELTEHKRCAVNHETGEEWPRPKLPLMMPDPKDLLDE